MKRLVGVIIIATILYIVYYDLSQGTLPASFTIEKAVSKTNTSPQLNQAEDRPYFEKKVNAGDTVISIIEEQLNDSISIPITEVVSDFKELNNGVSPQEIQQGRIYRFPDYSKQR